MNVSSTSVDDNTSSQVTISGLDELSYALKLGVKNYISEIKNTKQKMALK